MAYMALHDITCNFIFYFFSLPFVPGTLASFSKLTKHTSSLGILHWFFLLPEMVFTQLSEWLNPSHASIFHFLNESYTYHPLKN